MNTYKSSKHIDTKLGPHWPHKTLYRTLRPVNPEHCSFEPIPAHPVVSCTPYAVERWGNTYLISQINMLMMPQSTIEHDHTNDKTTLTTIVYQQSMYRLNPIIACPEVVLPSLYTEYP